MYPLGKGQSSGFRVSNSGSRPPQKPAIVLMEHSSAHTNGMLKRDILPIRIGVESTVAPYRWSDLKSLSGMSSETAHGLASSGKRMGPIRAGGAEHSRLSAPKSGGPSSTTTVWSGCLSNGRALRVGRRGKGPMNPRPCCLSAPMNQWGISRAAAVAKRTT